MRTILRGLRGTIAIFLACAVGTLPSCASMGGGGMKGMLAEPASVSAQGILT